MERFITYFKPTSYKLDLLIDNQAEDFSGEVLILGESQNEDKIKLHAVDMEIISVELNAEKIDNFAYDQKVLTIPVAQRAEQEIKISFRHKYNTNMQGCYLSTYKHDGKEERIISTQFESHYARECFPCVDEPEAKAVFTISISRPTDSANTVLSNSPLETVVCKPSLLGDQNLITSIFKPTPRMSTYLLAFVVGNFKGKTVTNENGVKITSYCSLAQDDSTLDFANEVAARSLEYYDEKFGVKYPLEKLDQVGIPDFEAGAMENWGLVTYRESMFLADQNATIDTKKCVALTVAHELSHQWFGNLVTMKWWDDLWLNESFASIMEYKAVDAIYPEFDIFDEFFTRDCLNALRRDAEPDVQSVRQPVYSPEDIEGLFDGAIVYSKGAHLMFMLSRCIGEDLFFKNLQTYFKTHAYANAEGNDLWAALQNGVDWDVKTLMDSWLNYPGYPLLSEAADNKPENRFTFTGTVAMPNPEAYQLPANCPIEDFTGHFITLQSQEKFAETLDNWTNLTREQQIRILSNQILLSKSPLVSNCTTIDLAQKFQSEQNPVIWELNTSLLAALKIFTPYESPEYYDFAKFLNAYLKPQIEARPIIPAENESSDTIRMRAATLGFALYAKNPEVTNTLADAYSDNFDEINPEIRGLVFDAKMERDEAEAFDKFLARYQEAVDPEIKAELLYTICSAKLPENTDKIVKLLSEPKIVKPQDHLHLFIYLRRNPKVSERVLDWLDENWQYVKDTVGGKTIDDYPRYAAGAVKTPEEYRRYTEIFGIPSDVKENSDAYVAYQDKTGLKTLENNPKQIADRILSIAHTEIQARLDLIARDKDAVIAKLREQNQ